MRAQDLYSALRRYDGTRSAENYLTESFAYLLRSLLREDPHFAAFLINRVCGVDDAFVADECERIDVRTQVATEHGIPDLVISAPGKLLYVEVKDHAEPVPEKLAGYRREVEGQDATLKRLVLLTRWAPDLPVMSDGPHHCVRWFEVHHWIAATLHQRGDVARFLAGEFVLFMEAQGMAINRVGWELMPGLEALMNFMVMFDAAFEEAGLKSMQGQIRASRDGVGCSVEDSKFWCGLDYRRPLSVIFYRWYCPRVDSKVLSSGPYELGKSSSGAEAYRLSLEAEDVAFFALSKDNQLRLLASYIRAAYDTFKAAEAACEAAAGDKEGA